MAPESYGPLGLLYRVFTPASMWPENNQRQTNAKTVQSLPSTIVLQAPDNARTTVYAPVGDAMLHPTTPIVPTFVTAAGNPAKNPENSGQGGMNPWVGFALTLAAGAVVTLYLTGNLKVKV